MNKPKLRLDEKLYKFRVYQELNQGYMFMIKPVGFITLNTRNKRKALEKARELYPNIYISRVELYSTITKTYTLPQTNELIKEFIKKYGEVTEFEQIER